MGHNLGVYILYTSPNFLNYLFLMFIRFEGVIPWFMPAILRYRTDFSGTAWGAKDAVFQAGIHAFAPGEKIHVYWLLIHQEVVR